jgi:peptidoglycan/xylan/chitin deacetylase (PgdA/CDA1 family)
VAVALTFDDGPDPRQTGAVLDALDAAEAVATFFVVGSRVAEHPEVIHNAIARGHAVQAHCFSHIAHPDLTAAATAADIDRLLDTLAGIGVPRPSLWRPPFGLWTAATLAIAAERALQVVNWTLSTSDPDPLRTAAQTLREIDAGTPRRIMRRDAIVIMHDCTAESDRSSNAETVALIEPLVSRVRARGWELERLEAPIPSRRARGDDSVQLLPGG